MSPNLEHLHFACCFGLCFTRKWLVALCWIWFPRT
uniref:Uncharacterized protein n=1 Tax=Populus trichocarpa TaxID=3694 RepID=A0A3N7G0E1_POPTR